MIIMLYTQVIVSLSIACASGVVNVKGFYLLLYSIVTYNILVSSLNCLCYEYVMVCSIDT